MTGLTAPSRAVEASRAGGDSVTPPVLRGPGTTARGWEQKSEPVTLTTVQVVWRTSARDVNFICQVNVKFIHTALLETA